jgi:O-antigen/teichoic acid export membrane protein
LLVRNLIKNSGALALEQGLRMLTNIVSVGLIARYLGPLQFGQLNYAINIVAIIVPLAGLSLPDVVTRELLSGGCDRYSSVLRAAFRMRFFSGFACYILLSGWVIACGGGAYSTLLLIMGITLIVQAPAVGESYFQATHSYPAIVRWRICGQLFVFLLKLMAIFSALSLSQLTSIFALEVLVMSLVTMFALSRAGMVAKELLFFKIDYGIVKSLIKRAYPLIFAGILIACYFRVEQFMVEYLLGPIAYGKYMAAVRLGGLANLLFPPLLAALLPHLLKDTFASKDISAGHVSEGFLRCLQLLTPISIMLGFGFSICGALFGNMILGAQYKDSIVPIIILGIGVPAIVSGAIRAQYFLAQNCTELHTGAALLGIFVNTGLAWWLCPLLGLPGAAIATVIGAYTSAIGSSFFSYKTRNFGRHQFFSLFKFNTILNLLKNRTI